LGGWVMRWLSSGLSGRDSSGLSGRLAGGLTARQVVAQVERVTGQCARATGIEARVILCTLRHFDAGQSLETARLVEDFRGSAVAGFDIAGDEAGYPIATHEPAFRFARERGLNRTAHAGEARGPDSVWETLRACAPSRIGHGVRSVEDPSLVDHLRREGIHLEICPSSNVQTGACQSYEGHPVNRLLREGVSLGISTDARTITNVSLTEEYERVERVFGWGDAEFSACNRNALRAAFIPEETRQGLLKKLG